MFERDFLEEAEVDLPVPPLFDAARILSEMVKPGMLQNENSFGNQASGIQHDARYAGYVRALEGRVGKNEVVFVTGAFHKAEGVLTKDLQVFHAEFQGEFPDEGCASRMAVDRMDALDSAGDEFHRDASDSGEKIQHGEFIPVKMVS